MMNSVLKITLFTALGVLSPSVLVAQTNPEWVEVTTNAVGDRFLIDQNSVQRNDDTNTVWYWEYRDFREPNNVFVNTFVQPAINQPVYGVTMYQSVDCSSGIGRLRRLTVYGRDRQVIQRLTFDDAGRLTQPALGSSAGAVFQRVCSQREGQQEG